MGLTQHGSDPSFGERVVERSTIAPSRPVSAFPLPVLRKQYICPGETHPISRGVHLARMASFFPACRLCPFRGETGAHSVPAVEQWLAAAPTAPRSVFETDGVRGKWLNELTRAKGSEIAAAYASLLWDRAPVAAPSPQRGLGRRPTRPSVVLATDERISSPDMATGVAAGLRRFGCQVIDVGQVSGPCFRFAVRHLGASGGIHVTGSGGDPSITGLDFAGPCGAPISRWPENEAAPFLDDDATSHLPFGLAEIESRLEMSPSRPVRASVPQQSFRASVPYAAGLRRHFHALRPLSVVCGSASQAVRNTLTELFASLPCRLAFVDVPCRMRNVRDAGDADVRRVGEAVRETRSSIGALIDDDGRRCAFLDERGELLGWDVAAAMLIGRALEDRPRSAVVVEPESGPLSDLVRRMSGRIVVAGGTQASTAAAMDESAAVFGGGPSCRFWHRDEWPVCDAAVTLGKMLDALSQSDRPMSEVAARVGALST